MKPIHNFYNCGQHSSKNPYELIKPVGELIVKSFSCLKIYLPSLPTEQLPNKRRGNSLLKNVIYLIVNEQMMTSESINGP